MLKNVRLHIEKEEEKQQALEQKLAQHIQQNHQASINAFQRFIPSLLPIIENVTSTHISLFCNKDGEYNLVDYGLGRTFYGMSPKQEVFQQYASIAQAIPCLPFGRQHEADIPDETTDSGAPSAIAHNKRFEQLRSFDPLPKSVECLIVFGCGLGLHLEHLLTKHDIKHLVLYEPEIQYFRCSSMVLNWRSLLELAKKKGTALYLQIGKDGRDILDDLKELQQHFSLDKTYLYQHYQHTVFDAIVDQLLEYGFDRLTRRGLRFKVEDNYRHYCPPWGPAFDIRTLQDVATDKGKFQANLQALKKYYPNIYDEFKDYSPAIWLPVETGTGEINLLHAKKLVPWYGEEVKDECDTVFSRFSEQPNRDGLVLGYNGTKLAHYLHYQFVKRTEDLLKEEELNGCLPDAIQCLIMFGLGSGYQLETLLQHHNLEHLFICEPNPDFFYASLHALDWAHIFDKINASQTRLYINIGDDGTHLYRDLINQFYAIGPYILNNTYFYQSYYNASLNSAIGQLREQLRIVISMGEYFDHAYFGISQTREMLSRNTPVMTSSPAAKLDYDDKTVPVFLIGNGPSLDHSIEVIKTYQDKAILVTCGTSLQVMQRNGITPDFHLEVEQNRSTYDWAVLIDDLDFLKKVSLVSCNGIHPDTCDLYKDAYIAFKEGESSTVSALEVLEKSQIGLLNYSFPTVANLACELFSKLGFQSIYLLGVDLGFVDDKHHHSLQSSYYKEDGQESYDYADRNNTSLVVPGNFRKSVNTKHEFKISKQIIEELISKSAKTTQFYNCSDGARVLGTMPLPLDNIILTTDAEQKTRALHNVKHRAFSTTPVRDFTTNFADKYNQATTQKDLNEISTLLAREIDSIEDAERLIHAQKEVLFDSYRRGDSLLFYYLYGSMNYANALLTKLTHFSTDDGSLSESTQEAKRLWSQYFEQMKQLIVSHQDEYDVSCRYISEREAILNRPAIAGKRILVVTNSVAFAKVVAHCYAKNFPDQHDLKLVDFEQAKSLNETFDTVIYQYNRDLGTPVAVKKMLDKGALPIKGALSTVAVIYNDEVDQVRQLGNKSKDTLFVAGMIDRVDYEQSEIGYVSKVMTYYLLTIPIQNYQCDLVLFKYRPREGYQVDAFISLTDVDVREKDRIFDYDWYQTVYFADKPVPPCLPTNGTRGKEVYDKQTPLSRVKTTLDESAFEKVKQKCLDIAPELSHDAQFKAELA